jgi:gamma-glutamylcyclotransferase (GGCT)/AIG2-like uncharacterized protein YtfP
MSFLFAYGSLRTAAGYAPVRAIVARLKPIGTTRLPGRLYYLGSYPGAIFDAGAAEFVVGDVFELADARALLAEIDAYEGYDPGMPDAGEYLRRRQAVDVAGIGTLDCWLYELRHVPTGAVAIDSGDYVAWLNNRQT